MSIIVKENVSLAAHTVFKIGGPARFFIEVRTVADLKEALSYAHEKGLRFFVAGAGSNILVADKGFDGLYIKNGAHAVSVERSELLAESGAMMASAAAEAAKAGLGGFEWGVGIPGTIGGSVRGNAGCFGGEVKDVLQSVEVFDADSGKTRAMMNTDCAFGYRESLFKKNPCLVILSARFTLWHDNLEAVRARMRDLAEKRAVSQDVGAKCAGCIFKNIPWARKDIDKEALLARFPILKKFESLSVISAGFLIDEVGLKGKRIGGAVISRKHANFFMNTEDASAEDVVMLIALAKEYVHRKFGILLQEEIQYVGFK